jgi:hypothetical protein
VSGAGVQRSSLRDFAGWAIARSPKADVQVYARVKVAALGVNAER